MLQPGLVTERHSRQHWVVRSFSRPLWDTCLGIRASAIARLDSNAVCMRAGGGAYNTFAGAAGALKVSRGLEWRIHPSRCGCFGCVLHRRSRTTV